MRRHESVSSGVVVSVVQLPVVISEDHVLSFHVPRSLK